MLLLETALRRPHLHDLLLFGYFRDRNEEFKRRGASDSCQILHVSRSNISRSSNDVDLTASRDSALRAEFSIEDVSKGPVSLGLVRRISHHNGHADFHGDVAFGIVAGLLYIEMRRMVDRVVEFGGMEEGAETVLKAFTR